MTKQEQDFLQDFLIELANSYKEADNLLIGFGKEDKKQQKRNKYCDNLIKKIKKLT